MRKCLHTTDTLCVSSALQAEDLITLKSGEELRTTITRVTPTCGMPLKFNF